MSTMLKNTRKDPIDWPEECKICHTKFSSKTGLQRHENRFHSAKKAFFCDDCGKSFKYEGNLKQHKTQVHSNAEKPYKCNLCPMSFWRLSSLDQHQLKHTGDKPYQCNICTKTFTSSSYVKAHEDNVHRFPQSRRVPCQVCGKCFVSNASLTIHVKAVHEKVPVCSCVFCNKNFSSKSNLKTHLYRHIEEKYYSCELCKKSYASRAERDGHRLSTHFCQHQCMYCRLYFKSKLILRGHVKIDHPEKIQKVERRHFCVFCGFDFKTRQSFENHLRVHIEEKPHICNICDTGFSQSSGLNGHIQKMHSVLLPWMF